MATKKTTAFEIKLGHICYYASYHNSKLQTNEAVIAYLNHRDGGHPPFKGGLCASLAVVVTVVDALPIRRQTESFHGLLCSGRQGKDPYGINTR